MDLAWLEDFLALVEQRNFSRAAEFRHVTQPAFSRRIRALEEWIGAPLFARTSQSVVITPAGECFRSYAESVTRALHQARRETLEIAGRETAGLIFAATHALSFSFFPDWIKTRAPLEALGTLSLVSDSMEACERILLQGRAHFLLCHHHRGAATRFAPGQFQSLVVGEDVLVPLCASAEDGTPKWALATGRKKPARYLSYSSQSGLGRILAANMTTRTHQPTLETVFTSHLAAALLSMARQGEGVAWLPKTLTRDDMSSGRLVDAGGGEFSVPVEIRLFRSSLRQSPVAEAFWKNLPLAKN